MCGIAGILDRCGRYEAATLRTVIGSMLDRMVHRGPDDSGVWLSDDGRCALGHRRLSIIDVSVSARQPMVSASGRSVLTYNGEYYGFLDKRTELHRRGLVFRTQSDTEVLLEALELEGDALLPKLDAMFALGIYDRVAGELLLARDLFGEKPLYYYDSPDLFAFASELQALSVVPGFDTNVDSDAVAA